MKQLPRDGAATPRCPWPGDDPQMIVYHDQIWGVPERDDRKLFAKLMLDMFQAGLSWRTILHKEQNFRSAFSDFDLDALARFGARERRRLLNDAGIVRNRMKIDACLHNAGLARAMRQGGESLAKLLWSFTGGKTLRDPRGMTSDRLPAKTPEAEAMAKELKRRGFKFLGPTICYAFMQAVGMVDDHVVGCFRYVPRPPERVGKAPRAARATRGARGEGR